MFGKGHFEGQYRTKPVVSIRGATKYETKKELLERAHQERANREAKRQEIHSAIKIQALIRGFIVRRRIYRHIRDNQVPLLKKQYETNTKDTLLLQKICRLIVFSCDVKSVSWVCQAMVRERAQILSLLINQENITTSWVTIACKLSLFCIQFIAEDKEGVSIAPCLRFFEVYCATGSVDPIVLNKVYSYLVPRGYFGYIRRIINSRVPPVIEECIRAPTPLSQEILQMIFNSISVASRSKDTKLKKTIYLSMLKEIFCDDLTEQIKLFILPCLSSCKEFQFSNLVLTLDSGQDGLGVPATPALLYSILYMSRGKLSSMDRNQEAAFLSVVSSLVRSSIVHKVSMNHDEDEDDEFETMEVDHEGHQLVDECIKFLNSQEFIDCMLQIVKDEENPSNTRTDFETNSTMSFGQSSIFGGGSSSAFGVGVKTDASVHSQIEKPRIDNLNIQNMRNLCKICHQLILLLKEGILQYALLKTLSMRGQLLRTLWQLICSTSQPSLFGSPTPLISIVSRGLQISTQERDEIAPLLTVFCSSFQYLLRAIDDHDFFGTTEAKGRWMPFKLPEMVKMSLTLRDLTLGLIDLGFPESRPTVNENYKHAVNSVRDTPIAVHDAEGLDVHVWEHIFRKVYSLLKQLYIRDTRHQFCPEGHWISPRISLPQDRSHDITFRGPRLASHMPFRGLRVLTRDDLEESGPPLTTKEAKLATVLRRVPFLISFNQRVLLFQNLIHKDKQEYQGDRVNFMQGPSINIVVRRDYIYEDAFEKLSPENEPNIKLKMRVQLINAAGLDEAGIDGGGLFREFLSQLIKTAFDPNRGFFVLTRDHQLYPNPSVYQIHNNASAHYYFIGRVIGKALYENLLVELPLAGFFLNKLLVESSDNLDIGMDYLDSLDPELYKNLMYLKSYDGDVTDLGLDFTVNVEEFGKTRVELLKPEGDKIPVTAQNRIEYIYRVAGYKLNIQIKEQCLAFRKGIYDVVGLDWLRMFSYRELATLISGAEHEINIEDLKTNTNYAGGFGPDHPTILAFWQVVRAFTEEDKKSLLKFVTSCSRPPLLGFRDLDPPFCIQNAGSEPDRLPTASTCMNLLKLPDFKTEDVLKKKLSYAIRAGAGFELS